MSRHLIRLSAVVAVLLLGDGLASAGEISFLEDFSLAPDRSVALKTLIPGTEDHFYYHSLHLQNQEKYAEVDAVMKRWLRKVKSPTAKYREIENRQVLLRYAQQPMLTLDFLRNRLKLNLNHQRRNARARAQLPTALNADLISRQVPRVSSYYELCTLNT